MRSIFARKSLAEDRELTDGYPFDPNLLPAMKNLLPKLRNPAKQSAYAEFLARKIKRNPRDLLSHVQRIYLNYVQKNEEAYFGAVVDLLIALGSNGLALKKSVLRPTYGLLENEHEAFIKKHLHSGINATQLIPTRESRLSKGLSSTAAIVIGKAADDLNIKPLPSAREKLSSGNLVTAQVILENALEQDPGDIEIAYELLELYRSHQMAKAFKTMTTRLTGKTLAAQEKWAETETYLSQL